MAVRGAREAVGVRGPVVGASAASAPVRAHLVQAQRVHAPKALAAGRLLLLLLLLLLLRLRLRLAARRKLGSRSAVARQRQRAGQPAQRRTLRRRRWSVLQNCGKGE